MHGEFQSFQTTTKKKKKKKEKKSSNAKTKIGARCISNDPRAQDTAAGSRLRATFMHACMSDSVVAHRQKVPVSVYLSTRS